MDYLREYFYMNTIIWKVLIISSMESI